MIVTRYYAGKWNGHSIVLVNDDAEQLLVDGKEVARNKPGLHMIIDISGEIPMEDGQYAHAHWDGGRCACIVGKPLEMTYDKATKIYSAQYEGHKLEADNKKFKGKLRVDGVEVDREDGSWNISGILGSKPDRNGKRFMVVMSLGATKVNCMFYAEAENVIMYPCQKQGGELVPINEIDDGTDDFITGMMIGAMLD